MRESPALEAWNAANFCGTARENARFRGIAALAALLYTKRALRPESQQLRRHPRPRGGVVTQRSAKPFTPVQFRPWPPTSRDKSEQFQERAVKHCRTARFLCKASTP